MFHVLAKTGITMVFSLPSASFRFLCTCLLRSMSVSAKTLATSSRRTSGTWFGAFGPRLKMNVQFEIQLQLIVATRKYREPILVIW